MKYVTGFFLFWYDFLIGDAWEIAAGVVITLALIMLIASASPALATPLGPLLAIVVVAVLSGSLWQEARR